MKPRAHKTQWIWDWNDCGIGTATHCRTGMSFWVTPTGWAQPVGRPSATAEEVRDMVDDLQAEIRRTEARPIAPPPEILVPSETGNAEMRGSAPGAGTTTARNTPRARSADSRYAKRRWDFTDYDFDVG